MSAHLKDGGPAYPQHGWSNNPETNKRMSDNGGMTLRDWFAGQEVVEVSEEVSWKTCEALAGERPSGNWDTNPIEWLKWQARWVAQIKYIRADAMLDARKEDTK